MKEELKHGEELIEFTKMLAEQMYHNEEINMVTDLKFTLEL